jgi:hypothetical protein
MKTTNRWCIMFVIPMLLSSGCYYYRSEMRSTDYSLLKSAHAEHRIFILHQNDSVWLLENVLVFEKDQDITGILQALPSNRRHYLLNREGKNVRLRKRNLDPDSELHLYVSNLKTGDNGFVRIPLADIVKTEVYTINKSKTAATHVLAIGGAVLALTGVVFAIAWQSAFHFSLQ